LAQLREQRHNYNINEVDSALEEISCRFDPNLYRQASAAAHVVLGHLFKHQRPELPFTSPDGRETAHVEELRGYQSQGLGIVYLSNHSSHLDEFIIDVLLDSLQMGLPLFAAGTNMMTLPNLAQILMIGSYTVQRRASGKVYLACLSNYCRAIAETGHQQGIFLEAWHGGARSRDGSLRFPRRLITLRGALSSAERDLVIQPAAISYAIVPEDLYLAGSGGAWGWVRGMGFWHTLLRLIMNPKRGLWRAAQDLYGRAYCTLTRPRLLSELRQLHAAERSELNFDEFVALTAMRDIAAAKKIMAVQLAARGLIRAEKSGRRDLMAALEEEREQIIEYHRATFNSEPDFEDFIAGQPLAKVLQDGLQTLKRRKITGWGKRQDGLPKVRARRALSFYATHGDRRLYSPTARENIVVSGSGDLSYVWAYLIGNRTLEEKRYLNASFTLYDSRSEAASEMGVERSLTGLYNEYRLPKNVFVTDDAPSAFKKANMVVMAPPLEELEAQIKNCLDNVEMPIRMVLLSNGFAPASNKLSFQIAMESLRAARTPVELFALAGPVNEFDLLRDLPGQFVLAGPNEGLREIGHLFRWNNLQVVIGDDPLGLHLALVLAEIYGVWRAFSRLGKDSETPPSPGSFATQVSVEANLWAEALGARKETFNAASPIWLTSLGVACLSRQAAELASEMFKQQGKTKENQSLLYSAKKSETNAAFRDKLRQSFISLKVQAEAHNLDLPIFYKAYAIFMGGGTVAG
jgi:glycerol-3-phosphate dehydrogenase